MCKKTVLPVAFVIVLSLVCAASADVVYVDATEGEAGNTIPAAGETLTVPFSLGAAADVYVANDPKVGPDSRGNGSGVEARNIPDRRSVALISYDISPLKGRGPVSNVSFSHFSHDQHGEVNVYGVIEDLDLLDVESLTWNTAPGVQNDPTPELNAPVALDLNDLTDVLLTFAGPGETGVRFSTDTSQALADFINSDTDGIVTFLIAASAENNQLIVRSSEHSAGGTLLQGDIAPLATIIWVADNLRYNFDTNEPADIGFVNLLRAQGYYVDYKGEYMPHEPGNDEAPLNPDWQYWRELDPNKIAELEAADLIIVARDVASSTYDDTGEAEMWNAISTPLIMQGPHLARTLPKWGWFDSGSTSNKTPRLMTVTAPDHPIFAGVELDPNSVVALVDPNTKVTLIKDPDIGAGNGRVLGLHDEGLTWIAEWDEGVEFYEGSTTFAGGPRMWFGSAVGASDEALGYVEGAYNLTADGEIIFLNAVAYMLVEPPIVENGSFELPGTDKFKAWDGEKAGEGGEPATDIPGWSSDSTPVDSGVESGWGATDGEWTAFLKGADPSVWQLTDFVMAADDVIELKVDAKNNWQATTLQLSMYIDIEGVRVPVAVAEFVLTDAMQEFTLAFAVQDDPLAADMRLGVELANVSVEGESWIGVDNVRVEVK
jgi:hypothetical protein